MQDHQRMQIEYRGYVVHFAENQEIWRCAALDVEAEKMAQIKTKIDKIISAARKLPGGVIALYVDHQDTMSEVRVVAFAEPRKDRRGNAGDPDAAWCMRLGRERYFDHTTGDYAYRDTEKREKLELARLYADTPENREKGAALSAANKEITALYERKKTIRSEMTKAGDAFHIAAADPETDNG